MKAIVEMVEMHRLAVQPSCNRMWMIVCSVYEPIRRYFIDNNQMTVLRVESRGEYSKRVQMNGLAYACRLLPDEQELTLSYHT